MMICSVAGSTFLRWTWVCLLSLRPLMNMALQSGTIGKEDNQSAVVTEGRDEL